MPFFKRFLSKIGKVINVPLVLEFHDYLDSDKDFIFLCEQCDRNSKLLKCWETAMCCSSIFFLAKFLTLSLSNSLSYSTIWSTKLMWSHFLNNYCLWPKMDEKMSVYFCSGKFRKGHLEQIFNYGIASMEMINKEQNLLQVKSEFRVKGISCHLNFSLCTC